MGDFLFKGVSCMKESTKEYLTNIYNGIPTKTKATCLKFHYVYNKVNVNVYFDAFDNQSVVLSIVLALVEEKKYYFTPLNILDSSVKTEYLSKIPIEILEKILVDDHLDDFYETMENHLLNGNHCMINYSQDKYFVNTIKYAKNNLDLPFWYHLRKVPMTDERLYRLNARADITFETLRKIQQEGFTLVRTADPQRRKELTLILQEESIKLS